MRSRMSTWFETKVRYTKAQEDGSEKPVTEAYVVDALSFTEAESRITDEMAVYVSGEFKVSGISKAAYGEVFFSDMDGDDNGTRPSCRLSPLMTKPRRRSVPPSTTWCRPSRLLVPCVISTR